MRSVVAYAWWPSDNEAGVASLQALYDSGVPVIQTNQLPFPGSEEFVVGYAGVNDTLNGEVAAGLVVEARDWLVDNGATLHSEGGNAIIVGFVAGYQAGIDRSAAAIPILEDAGIAVLGEVEVGFDPQTGYEGTKQLIAAHRDEGIDLVYAHNSSLAEGVIQALEEEGYTPGEDVMVVGGTCHGNLEYLEDGSEFATGLQAARLEGVFSIDTLDEYLTDGRLAEFGNFIPNPPVHSPGVHRGERDRDGHARGLHCRRALRVLISSSVRSCGSDLHAPYSVWTRRQRREGERSAGMTATNLFHVGILVPDLDEAVARFTEVLGLYVQGAGRRPCRPVRAGDVGRSARPADLVVGRGSAVPRAARVAGQQRPLRSPHEGLHHVGLWEPDPEALIDRLQHLGLGQEGHAVHA